MVFKLKGTNPQVATFSIFKCTPNYKWPGDSGQQELNRDRSTLFLKCIEWYAQVISIMHLRWQTPEENHRRTLGVARLLTIRLFWATSLWAVQSLSKGRQSRGYSQQQWRRLDKRRFIETQLRKQCAKWCKDIVAQHYWEGCNTHPESKVDGLLSLAIN